MVSSHGNHKFEFEVSEFVSVVLISSFLSFLFRFHRERWRKGGWPLTRNIRNTCVNAYFISVSVSTIWCHICLQNFHDKQRFRTHWPLKNIGKSILNVISDFIIFRKEKKWWIRFKNSTQIPKYIGFFSSQVVIIYSFIRK